MSEVSSVLPSPIDAGLGGVLLANMVEAWLAGNPDCLASAEEATDEALHHGEQLFQLVFDKMLARSAETGLLCAVAITRPGRSAARKCRYGERAATRHRQI